MTDDAAERRRRLEERRGSLSAAARERLSSRLRGAAGEPEAPRPGRCRVVVTPGPGGEVSRPPFFAVHPAGGDVLCFFPLARHLGGDQPFIALQAPGLEDDSDPPATLEEMAAAYCSEVRAAQPAGPYRLGGWSFGGLVAFEMARQLAAEGEEVRLLAVIDTTPGVPESASDEPAGPGGGEGDDDGDDTVWLLSIAEYVKGLRGLDLGVSRADLAPLGREERLALFVERMREARLFHSSSDSLLQLRRLLAVYKTNARLFREHRPRPYPGAVTLFRGEQAGFDPALGEDLGWSAVSALPVAVERVPGDHITLLAEPHVAAFAACLRRALDAAAGPNPKNEPAAPPSRPI